jgi:hypothetical protein
MTGAGTTGARRGMTGVNASSASTGHSTGTRWRRGGGSARRSV